MRRDALAAWTKLALHAGEIAWFAPFVIQQRGARMLTRPHAQAAKQREAMRMIVEKVEAMQEAQWLLWQQAVNAQQQAWLAAWQTGLGLSASAPRVAMTRAARDAANAARRALQPLRRRVKANARRLKRRT
jgi:hypothetical protein